MGIRQGGGFERRVPAGQGLSARSGRWRLGLAALALMLALGVLADAPASSLALSEGRAYELVTPPYKGGYGAGIVAASLNGEKVLFFSLGVFAGTPRPGVGSFYLAHREAGKGWSTTPEQPPISGANGIAEFSPTLEFGITPRTVGHNEVEYVLHSLASPDTPADWEVFPGEIIMKPVEEFFNNDPSYLTVDQESASSDLCHLVVDGINLSAEAPYQSTEGHKFSDFKLYDLARGCRGEGPWFRMIGARNRLGPHEEPEPIRPECPVVPGYGGNDARSEEENHFALFNMVSGDGSEIFFTTDAEETAKFSAVCTHPQLFVRLGGSRTVEVSRPVDPSLPFGGCGEGGSPGEVPGEVPCAGAASRLPSFFKGASEDGSRVFFTSKERLVSGDTDNTNQLYMARIGCPESEPACEPAGRRVLGLTDVSHSQLAGETGEVLGVASVANDGSHVYFVAQGILTNSPNAEDEVAAKGADNLYVYDAETQRVSFVADLCAGAGASGSRADARCPSVLTSGKDGINDEVLWGIGVAASEVQSTGNGAFLVFSSYGRLIGRGGQLDADSAKDVYRYDAETETLDRVSLGEGGYDANGNGGGFNTSIPPEGILPDGDSMQDQHELATRAVSENGSRIVFSSSAPLSPNAINGRENIYIWRKEPGWSEGRVSMISTGSSLTNDVNPVITPDGENVFFATAQGLVPADTENDVDVYDARVGGGFPLAAAERVQCASDGCQGALTNPAPLLVPGSAVQAPGGNFAAPAAAKHAVKTKKKVKAKKAKTHRRSGRAHGMRATRTGSGRRVR